MAVKGICPCVSQHLPQPTVLNAHHIIPKSWGGMTIAANLIDICPTTHVNIHHLIDEYVHVGGTPVGVLRNYNAFVRGLAARAWAGRPNDHPPITSLHQPTP